MKKSRFTEEQIIRALNSVESGEKKVYEMCREVGITHATYYKWKRKYAGLDVNEARRLKELEIENSKLKRMVANLMLEKEAVEDVLKKL